MNIKYAIKYQPYCSFATGLLHNGFLSITNLPFTKMYISNRSKLLILIFTPYGKKTHNHFLFPHAMSHAAAHARIFGVCRKSQYPIAPLRCKFDIPSACCGIFDSKHSTRYRKLNNDNCMLPLFYNRILNLNRLFLTFFGIPV